MLFNFQKYVIALSKNIIKLFHQHQDPEEEIVKIPLKNHPDARSNDLKLQQLQKPPSPRITPKIHPQKQQNLPLTTRENTQQKATPPQSNQAADNKSQYPPPPLT